MVDATTWKISHFNRRMGSLVTSGNEIALTFSKYWTRNCPEVSHTVFLQFCVCFYICTTFIPRLVRVIPQKLKLPMDFFETFPECCLPSTVSKNTIKVMGHHSRLRDMSQSYPINGCSRANHTFFIGPSFILQYWSIIY